MPPLPKSWQVGNLRSKEKTYYRCPRCSVPSVPIIVDTPVCPLCGEETEVYVPTEGEKTGEVLVKTKDQLLAPYWQDGKGRVRIFQGDVRAKLKCIPSNSIQCVVTSPPYWGLRDYGTATWVGGDPKCSHTKEAKTRGNAQVKQEGYKDGFRNAKNRSDHLHEPYLGNTCGKCGAKRIDAQIGSEERPDCLGWATGNKCGECHVCVIVAVFREVKRVLRNDGVLWLNYGDSYSNPSGYKEGRTKDTVSNAVLGKDGAFARRVQRQSADGQFHIKTKTNIPEGNLVGIPWRVAFALQADGWILRQDICWAKENPMRESVRSRCTKSHEYVFHLTKSNNYYYDCEAIKVRAASQPHAPRNNKVSAQRNDAKTLGEKEKVWAADGMAMRLSVWTINPEPYPGAHYATMPTRLVSLCILAGTSAHGACVQCGAPWERITERTEKRTEVKPSTQKGTARANGEGMSHTLGSAVTTLGWQPTCQCYTREVRPCTVLDPFFGSGTTGDVCIQLGRHCVGVELSEKYIRENAIPRVEKAIIKCAWTKKAERRQ